MKVADFDFLLPEKLIAKYPTEKRTESRLLCLNKASGEMKHKQFADIIDFIKPNDLLVVNNSRVIPARIYGKKASGGKIEVLIERLIGSHSALAHIRSSKSPKPGATLLLGNDLTPFSLIDRDDALFRIQLNTNATTLLEWLHQYGHMPLPPYIDRPDETKDQERYQTVYSQPEGSVAAPTAGLHFDNKLLSEIKDKGTQIAEVTLHVGAGTFQPVRVDSIEDHRMHYEWISIPEVTCQAIKQCKKRGGKIIAVGTTSVRSLETAAIHSQNPQQIEPFEGETNIFLYPGKPFHVVDTLITNFHLPKSTLLMLVSALSSKDKILSAYQEAIDKNYRFFSYGDAMLIY